MPSIHLRQVMPTIDDSIQVTMRLLQEASLGSDKAVNMHPFVPFPWCMKM
jgi:hypothetical protein